MEDLVNDQLDCGKGSWSLDGGGSNQVMLYGSKRSDKKRKNTNKGCKGIQLNKKPKLSKSQKRKMMKLEEEKEKSLLLSKSLETLEKYKISDDAFLLLRSSVNIGKDETRLEKRSRDIQFSKVGIEVPGNDQQLDKTWSDISQYESQCGSLDISPCHQLSANADEDGPFVAEKEVTCGLDSFKDLDDDTIVSNDGKSLSSLPDKVENTGAVLLEDERDLSCTMSMCTVGDLKGPEITDKEDEIPKVEICTTSNPLPEMRLLSKPIVVPVSRPFEVEDKRKDLPIVMMEQEIMEAINENPIVIICGETGCGKTTQVPQFLYEAGFGSLQSSHQRGAIGVTQPRRVAVLATAKRVAYELGVRLGKEVGFQVRYDKKIGDSSSIKFMTDGILLREVQHDFLLKRYSVLILDEAHERSMNTDILIGMLSRVVKLRQDLHMKQRQIMLSGGKISPENMIFPLKLVLMSATLRVEDFISGGRLFHVSPPIIEVPTRQFPVTVHFSKRTDIVDYIGQAYKKVLAIHKKLPPGGILVFVTGQREVENLCKKLREASKKLIKKTSERNGGNNNGIVETNSIQNLDMNEINEAFEDHEFSIEQTDRFSSFDKDEFDINDDVSDASYNSESDSELEFNEDAMSDETDGTLTDVIMDDASMSSLKAAFDALDRKNALDLDKRQVDHTTDEDLSSKQCVSARLKENVEFGFSVGALHVLPLYAMLPAAAQLHVFEEVKEGERLVVVATNVAETSLTIPGIKYVVDTGREKVKTYNSSNGIENYEVQWISKASAAQRAGRSGRTGPGHCYRLYSSAVFSNILPDFSLAEIAKIPVDGVVLLMKSMGIDKVVNFPFPTPPETSAVLEAESCLKALEALDSGGRLTPLGKAMARYPLSPRHSRMLLTVIQIMRNMKNYDRANLVLAYSVAAAAALSMSNPFVMMFEGSQMKDELEQKDRSFELGDTKTEEKVERSLKKKLKEAAKLSREKFSDHSSDALTIAYALQCFELSETPVAFCNNYTLHLKTMQEMSKLRKQLLQLVFNHSPSIAESDFSWTNGTLEDVEAMWRVPSNKHPLSLKEKEIIGQAICAGWPDRVAKRIREISKSVEADRKERAGKYQACMVKENVFVNHWSSVSRSAPKFLVYNELLCTKRPYMHGLTSVQPDWLVKYASSLCAFSAPLTDPKPYYNPQNDTVYSWVVPTFGPHLWELPLHNFPIKDNAQGVAVFACALLKGKVLPCLTSVREFMAARPSSILRPEALGQKRVGNLLSRLKSKKINSRATLRAVWKDNPYELHSEILDWFQKSYHSHFEDLWSQMLCEVQLPQKHLIKKLERAKEKKKKLMTE